MNHLLAIAFAVGIYNLVFFNQPIPVPGTMGAAWLIASLNIFTLLAFGNKLLKKPTAAWLIWGVLAVIVWISGLSVLRGNFFDRLILTGTALGMSGLVYYLLAKPKAKILALSEMVLFPLLLLVRFFPALAKTLEWVKHSGLSQHINFLAKPSRAYAPSNLKASALFRGFIISAGILFFIISLLASGDAAFGQFLSDLFNFEFEFNLHNRVLLSLVLAGVSLPLTFIRVPKPFISPLADTRNATYGTEMFMLVSSVLGIMILYLIIQAPYLFATVSETQLHTFGVQTYSEYVRKGFVELSLVSAIIYGVTALAYLVIRARTVTPDWLKWLTISLLTTDLIFIGSIFRRVYLYASSHGLTLARVYGAIILVAIIGWTLTLIARLVFPKKYAWHYLEASVILTAIVLPSFINPEMLTWRYAPPTVNNELDYTYIARMGPDAAVGWLEAYQHVDDWFADNPTIFDDYVLTDDEYRMLSYHQQTLWALENHWQRLDFSHESPNWFAFNKAEIRALQLLQTSIERGQLQQRRNQIDSFLNQYFTVKHNPPVLDRSNQSPLL